MSGNILNFGIGVDLSELDKSVNQAISKTKDMTDKINSNLNKVGDGFINAGKKASIFSAGVAAVGVAVFALSKNVGNIADRLLDLSDITGMATDTIQEYQYVAKIAGVNTEAVTNATEGLVRRLKDVSEDGGGAVEVMRNLGVAVSNNDGTMRNSGKIMDDLIVKLANMDNASQRNAYGSQLFGGAWKDMAPILAMGADNIEAIRHEAQELGLVMSNDALNSANAFRQANERLTAQMEALKNKIGAKLAPVLTKVLVPAIQKYLIPLFDKIGDVISNVIDWFSELNPTLQKTIGIIAGMAVAIGPLLLAIGGIIKFMPILISGFTALISPIGLVVAGILALTVVIVKNWSTVRQWAEDIANYFVELYNKSIVFRAGIELTILSLKNIFNVGKFVFSTLTEVVSLAVKNMATALKGLGGIIEGVFTFDYQKIKDSFNQVFREGFGNIKTAFKNIGKDAVSTFENIGKDAGEAFDKIMGNTLEKVSFAPIKDKVKEAVSEGVSEGLAQGVGGRAKTKGVGEVQGAGFTDMGINAKIPEVVKQAETGFLQYFEMLQQFEQDVNNLVMGSIVDTFSSLGDAIGDALANGENVFQAIGQSLLASMGKFISEMGGLLVQYGTMAVLKGKLDLAIATGGAVAVGAGVAAIAAGIALKAVGSAIASKAQGGFGGGSVGSNSVNTPQSNISSNTFTGSSDNEVVFRISGSDLVGVLNRNNNQNARLG